MSRLLLKILATTSKLALRAICFDDMVKGQEKHFKIYSVSIIQTRRKDQSLTNIHSQGTVFFFNRAALFKLWNLHNGCISNLRHVSE